MFNPLSPDLTGLSDDEITSRLNTIIHRMRRAPNQNQLDQLNMYLNETFAEQDRRRFNKAWQDEQAREQKKDDDPFKGLIDV